MVLLWAGSDPPTPSSHETRVSLSLIVAVTVAVDVMDTPITTSVTLNSNGGSGNTWPWLAGARVSVIPRDVTLHTCTVEKIVHVNTSCSPGHGLSTLDCNWVLKAAKEWHCSYFTSIKQVANSPCIQYQLSLRICIRTVCTFATQLTIKLLYLLFIYSHVIESQNNNFTCTDVHVVKASLKVCKEQGQVVFGSCVDGEYYNPEHN